MHIFGEREGGAEKYESQNDVKMFLIVTDDEEMILHRHSSMHMQSIAEWAPANIGPYSQAYTVSS